MLSPKLDIYVTKPPPRLRIDCGRRARKIIRAIAKGEAE